MDTAATLTDSGVSERGATGLYVLAWSPSFFTTYPLPDPGTVDVGRSAEAKLRLEDPLTSRLHARIHVGAGVDIEDLGSANGTWLRGERLQAGTRVRIAPGESVLLGDTVLVVQRDCANLGQRRLWSHAHFEQRLEQACSLAKLEGETFAVLRVRVGASTRWAHVVSILVREIEPPDFISIYGPGDYEVLLYRKQADDAVAVKERLSSRLLPIDPNTLCSLSLFPRDGLSAQALLAAIRVPNSPQTVSVPPQVHSPMQQVYAVAQRAAQRNINVMLLGETGVGKEVLTRFIHQSSDRAERRLVGINCAGLGETLLESELFGHERGAFTGAHQTKIGLLESAHGGTVLLDELGELPLQLQAKLLRVLETRMVKRVGGIKEMPIDVRFVSATNTNLEAAVEKGAFRRDLFFRLNSLTISIPPLRQRRAEVVPLARQFLRDFGVEFGLPSVMMSHEAEQLLEQYDWPGNIRELRNMIERALVLCGDGHVEAAHLPMEKLRRREDALAQSARIAAPPSLVADSGAHVASTVPPPRDAHLQERARIVAALAECAGNQTHAAKLLGIPRRTFVAKLKSYGIPRPRRKTIAQVPAPTPGTPE